MRAVIYARYSSTQQREASIADQHEVCRRYIERQGWTLSGNYEDAAISGASRFRPGLARLMTDAEADRFDVVVVEAVDRLGRKLSDVADLFDRLTFRRVAVHATGLGQLTQMHVGIMGTMAQMTLSDLREKTKRGQLGRARAGRLPGGLAYGYEVVAPAPGAREAGERRIRPDEAAIVRRIFTAYAAGTSPRRLAHDLNAEKIPGPGGRPWGDTTIRGQGDRGTGLLNNTLYVGRLSWNRCSYIKDPRTGRRVARVNDASQWEVVEVPELRVVEQTLWDRVKVRQAASTFETGSVSGAALNRSHRPVSLLGGLLTCGVCGGGYTMTGKHRIGCATRRGKGTCDNAVTIVRSAVERRVLDGLRDRMLTPELAAEFARAFEAETARLQREAGMRGAEARTRLAEIERKITGIVASIENGAWNRALSVRLDELESEQTTLKAGLKCAEETPAVVCLHPRAADLYRDQVAELEASLMTPEVRDEAFDTLRALIDRVVLVPDASAPDGLRIELGGVLAEILSLAGHGNARLSEPGVFACRSGRQSSVVAGTGFEPVTFRL